MIRVEYVAKAEFERKPQHGTFCESTLSDAKACVQAMADNGVNFIDVKYYDRDDRIRDIQAGYHELTVPKDIEHV